MNYKKYCSLTILACLFSLNINAAEESTSRQMTQEEYQMVYRASAEHMNCMNEFAISQLDKQADIRVIADHAMKECAPVLEELYNTLVEIDYDPEASKNIASSISNKAANKILSQLMMFSAARNNQ